MKIPRKLLGITGLAAVLLLAGCWHNSGGDPPVPPANAEVPDSAGASTAAFVSYLLTLSASDETSEPLTIKDTFAVPPDEANESTSLT